MSQRGPNLFSSDLGDIIRKEFKTLYSFDFNIEDITKALKNYFSKSFVFKEDWNLFWLIMARIQIDYGNLLDEVKDEALKVINSNEDIKQWEEYVEIEKYKINYADLTNELISKMLSNPQSNNSTDIFQENLKIFSNITEQAKNATLKKNVPDFVHEYYDKDSWSKIDIFGSDGKKYLKLRQEEIKKLFEDISNFKPFKKKVSKPYHFSPSWEVGDVIAFKIIADNDSRKINANYLGYYLLFRVTEIIKKPLSKIFPDLAFEEDIYIAQYDFIGKEPPTLNDLQHLDYVKRKKPRKVFVGNELNIISSDIGAIQYTWVSFYNNIKKYKKMDFIKIASQTDFPDVIKHDHNLWELHFIDELSYIFLENLFEDIILN